MKDSSQYPFTQFRHQQDVAPPKKHGVLQFAFAQVETPPKQFAHISEKPTFFLMHLAAHQSVHENPGQLFNASMTSASLVLMIFSSSILQNPGNCLDFGPEKYAMQH